MAENAKITPTMVRATNMVSGHRAMARRAARVATLAAMVAVAAAEAARAVVISAARHTWAMAGGRPRF